MDSKKDTASFSWIDLIKAMWFFLGEKRIEYVLLSIIIFTVYFYGLVPVLIIGKIVDFFTNYHTGDSLAPFYFYISVMGFSNVVVSVLRLAVKKRLSNITMEVIYNIRVKGFDKLIEQSIAWHDSENSGNKVQRIQTGTEALRNLLRLLTNNFYIQISTLIGVAFAFIFYKGTYVVLVVFYMLVFFLINYLYNKKLQKILNELNKFREKATGVYFEGISNLLTIKTLGVKDTFKQNVNFNEETAKVAGKKYLSVMYTKWQVFQIFTTICLVILLYMVGMDVVAGLISIGSIFVIFNYFLRFFDAAGDTTDSIDQFIEQKSGVGRMMFIFNAEVVKTHGNKPFPQNWHTLSFENASFTYKKSEAETNMEQRDSGLKDVSLQIHKHEKVGIVGKSGSGKSTIAKILLGLYPLDEGKFNIDEENFYDVDHGEITSYLTLVLQESEMFNMSFRENITLMRDVDPTLFETAVEIAQLHDVVNKLPDKWDTLIGEKGYRLSGGERQRVGIARAICKDSQILILDEATSALDAKTESMIQKGIEEKLQKKTIIIIAHRVTTIQNVDKLYVFENGEIVEKGTYQSLSTNPKSIFNKISNSKEPEFKVESEQRVTLE